MAPHAAAAWGLACRCLYVGLELAFMPIWQLGHWRQLVPHCSRLQKGLVSNEDYGAADHETCCELCALMPNKKMMTDGRKTGSRRKRANEVAARVMRHCRHVRPTFVLVSVSHTFMLLELKT